LKPGQKICAKPKLKPVQIDAIARAIAEHALDNPTAPISYAVLEGRFGFTAVTLRSKPPIRAAMEKARSTAAQSIAEAKENSTTGEEDATTSESTMEGLRDEVRQMKHELENYRRDHQLLTLYFHIHGKTLSKVLTEASLHMSGSPTLGITNGGRGPARINPISRK